MGFEELGLDASITNTLQSLKYSEATEVQQQVIPHVLAGSDVLAGAQTGTGKTAGFTLPILQKLVSKKRKDSKSQIHALILTPTRELAAQVAQSVDDYGKYLPLKTAVIFGGVGINPQKAQLRKGVDIVIATPGRLLDLVEQKSIDLSHVECFVLDEADRMLDMGFLRDIQKVINMMPEKRQNLMFSATFSKEIKKLAHGILNHPVQVEATPENTTVEAISQKVYRVAKGLKTGLIIKLISEDNWHQVLVFTRTKHGANRLSEKMVKSGITAAAIHGNKSQGARTKALAGFKSGKVRVLVATDIAARGLDIPLLPHVINYELPNVPEDYVHRIGRTGRAGAEGEAISLVCSEETEYQKEIEKLLNEKLKSVIVEGFEPTDTAPPKRAATQSKGSFGKKKKASDGKKDTPKKSRRPSNNKHRNPANNSGRGRSDTAKSKRN